MNVIGYGRVSSIGQESGDGYDRQEAAIQAFCSRHFLSMNDMVNEAISGTVEGMHRPKLADILGAAQPGDIVIVERLDRLSRDLMVQELLIREFQKRGVKLYAADQGEKIDMADACPDPTRKLIRQVLGAVAEFEKTNLVRKLYAARVRTGNLGGSKPFGFYAGEKATLDAMRVLRDSGMSWREIADELNESMLPQRNGKHWTHSAVSNVMNNEKKARS